MVVQVVHLLLYSLDKGERRRRPSFLLKTWIFYTLMGTSTPRKYLMMGTRSTLKIPTPRLKVDVFLVFLHFQTPERHHTLYTTSLYPRRPILASLTMGNLLGHSYWGWHLVTCCLLMLRLHKVRTRKHIERTPSKSALQYMITCGFVQENSISTLWIINCQLCPSVCVCAFGDHLVGPKVVPRKK